MQGTVGLCSFVLIYRNTRPPQGVFLSPACNHDIYQHNKQYSKHDHNKDDSVQERQAFNEEKAYQTTNQCDQHKGQRNHHINSYS